MNLSQFICSHHDSHPILQFPVSTDKDECAKGEYTCWRDSDCSNLPDGQGYDCVCGLNYERYPVNVIAECVCKYSSSI